MSQRLIKGVADIYFFNVPIARPSDVVDAYVVRPHAANRSRTHQEPVVIKMNAGVVFVVVIAELRGVTLREEILYIEVPQEHLLMTVLEGVQPAVGVFFQEEEIGGVVLKSVRSQVSADANPRLLLREQQCAR